MNDFEVSEVSRSGDTLTIKIKIISLDMTLAVDVDTKYLLSLDKETAIKKLWEDLNMAYDVFLDSLPIEEVNDENNS